MFMFRLVVGLFSNKSVGFSVMVLVNCICCCILFDSLIGGVFM